VIALTPEGETLPEATRKYGHATKFRMHAP
jgi:hypothetical protein